MPRHIGYLRDKEKREVDFFVVRDRKPWFLVEVKHSDEADCFERPRGPTVVPARRLLSQRV